MGQFYASAISNGAEMLSEITEKQNLDEEDIKKIDFILDKIVEHCGWAREEYAKKYKIIEENKGLEQYL